MLAPTIPAGLEGFNLTAYLPFALGEDQNRPALAYGVADMTESLANSDLFLRERKSI